VTGLSGDARAELTIVLDTLRVALRHHRLRDEAAAVMVGRPVVYSPLTVRLEFATNGLAALIRHDFPGPEGEKP
jgi:hypothetical protein